MESDHNHDNLDNVSTVEEDSLPYLTRVAYDSLTVTDSQGVATTMNSSILPLQLSQSLCKALDQSSPALSNTPLLEHKLLRCIMSAKYDVVMINVDEQALMRKIFEKKYHEK